MFWKRSFKGKMESANRVFTATIEKLRGIQVDMTAQIDKNSPKIQNLLDYFSLSSSSRLFGKEV